MAEVTRLTIDSSKIPGSLTDYPVYVNLADMNAEFWSTVRANTNTHSLDLESSSSQYAEISDALQTGLDITGDFTFESWIKPESSAINGTILSKANQSSDVSYLLQYQTSNKIVLGVSDNGTFNSGNYLQFESNTTISNGVYSHIAVSFDISTETAKIYIDGVDVGVTKTSGTTMGASLFDSSAPFTIGSIQNSGTPGTFFDGLIDDVRVWNDIRTADEIRGNMHKELAGTETNLQGYWKLNNDYLDATSNNNDLTASGSPVFSTDYAFSTAGGDIRVFKSDGTTELPREVVSCDTTLETGELHFKYTGTLSSTVDTEVQIHADGTSADYATTATYGAENVWGTNYKGVWHLQATSGNAVDSTSNSNDLTDNNTVGTATGKIGNGRDFGLSNSEYFSKTDNASLSITGDISFSGWFKIEQLPSTSGTTFALQTKDDTSGSRSYAWYLSSSDELTLIYFDSSSNLTRSIADSATVVAGDVGNFVYLAGTADVSTQTITLYKNGSAVADTNDFSAASSIRDGTSDFRVGARNVTGSISEFFDGVMDEQRIYSGILSSDWITTEYNNQNSPSTFYTAESVAVTFTINETLSLTESESAIRARNFTVNETLTLSETVNAILTKVFEINETLHLTETVSNIRSRLFTITESLTLTETSELRKKVRNVAKNIATGISNRVKNIAPVKNRDKS